MQPSDPPAMESHCCPHLGVREDPGTCLGYPAEWNLCYRARPVAAVSLDQQRKLCLSPVYIRCAVFQSARRAPLPKHLRGARTGSAWKWVLLAALLVLTALGLWAVAQHRLAWAFPALGNREGGAALVVAPSWIPAPAASGACLAAPFSPPAVEIAPYTAPDLSPPAPTLSLIAGIFSIRRWGEG